MNKIIFITFLLLTASVCFGQTKTESKTAALKLEACEVYKAVLGDEKPLVIVDGVSGEKFGEHWVFSRRNPKFAVVHSETLRSYKKDNNFCEVNDFVNLEPKKTLIKFDEAQSFLERSIKDENAQKSFSKKYATDHYFMFSNVGFNKKRDQALLTMQWQCISLLCTDWFYIVLSKINGEWKVIRKEVIWSS